DDNQSIRTFLKIPLSSRYDIDEAENARSAVEKFNQNNPDLVILDLGLPDHDGFYVLEKIRQQETNAKVIILTVRDDNQSRSKAKKLGADFYMTKPFRFKEISE